MDLEHCEVSDQSRSIGRFLHLWRGVGDGGRGFFLSFFIIFTLLVHIRVNDRGSLLETIVKSNIGRSEKRYV